MGTRDTPKPPVSFSKVERFKNIARHPWVYMTFQVEGSGGALQDLPGQPRKYSVALSDISSIGRMSNSVKVCVWKD